ncbi:MFS general substrate transporter [Choiromyces venosus 120613-1]|uniref:MFS general substrate transporter n=1 Tax=Choiromyces venosus 120613-1 TaxID=1336337 RepID=A0A3N4JBW1_9PEZI|nr:MFS general substrate transporter [Choiromyces venosus 120613-1]
MPDRRLRIARFVSLAASTCIALSSGTNYVYSAYAPQLATRLHLTATESNLIGTFGNLGMYLSGIPSGILVDSKGPRLPVLIGAAALLIGYYPMYLAMESGKGSTSIFVLCFFSALTGAGSCSAFGGAMKAAALNFPQNRGTATALPLAAFGLSAFFFSFISSWLFPGNTSDFLLVLCLATSSIVFTSFFFLRVIPVPGAYSTIPSRDMPENNRLHRTKSSEGRHSSVMNSYVEPGTSTISRDTIIAVANSDPMPDEGSSFLTKSSSSGGSEEDQVDAESNCGQVVGNSDVHHGHHIDIRGWALTRKTEFWLLFCLLGLLTGTGLMTINNIGHSVQALWAKFAPDKHPDYVQGQQSMHVSILSLFSFSGRILSGVSSDILYRKYGLQRLWLIVASASIFSLAQLYALAVENPNRLWLVSSLSGLGYGVLFGVYPTIISEEFGLHGLSQNWGTMTVSAVISGQIFNLFYGRVYDDHSVITPEGSRECNLGLECYRNSYWITLGAVLLGLVTALGAIQRHRRLSGYASISTHSA